MTDERAKLVDNLRYRGALDRLMGGTMYQAADQIEADSQRIAELEAALKEVVDTCGECGGYGTYPAEETVTGKVLWWDCSNGSCKTARAALGGTK